MRISESLMKNIVETEKAFYESGGIIEISHVLPTIHIIFSDGEEYFFQESEAENLLDEVPEELTEKEYLIWVSQGW